MTNLVDAKNTIILGDFNVNLAENVQNMIQGATELKDILLENLPSQGYTQCVRNCTRHSSNTISSLIDHVWIGNMNKLI